MEIKWVAPAWAVFSLAGKLVAEKEFRDSKHEEFQHVVPGFEDGGDHMCQGMLMASRSWEEPLGDRQQGNGDLSSTTARTEFCNFLNEFGAYSFPEPPYERPAGHHLDFGLMTL